MFFLIHCLDDLYHAHTLQLLCSLFLLLLGEVAMGERQKGWFPRQCVSKEEVELRSHTPSDDVDVNEHKPLAATATTNQKAAAASKPEEGPRKRAKGKDEKKKRSRKTGKGKSGGGAEHAAKEE